MEGGVSLSLVSGWSETLNDLILSNLFEGLGRRKGLIELQDLLVQNWLYECCWK